MTIPISHLCLSKEQYISTIENPYTLIINSEVVSGIYSGNKVSSSLEEKLQILFYAIAENMQLDKKLNNVKKEIISSLELSDKTNLGYSLGAAIMVHAMEFDDYKSAKLLSKKIDLDEILGNGKTLLMKAAENGKKDFIELFVTNKANVNIKDDQNNIALSYLSKSISKMDLVYKLCNTETDFNSNGHSCNSLLEKFSFNIEIFRHLLREGANPNTVTTDGLPLICNFISDKSVTDHGLELVRHGFKPNIKILSNHDDKMEILLKELGGIHALEKFRMSNGGYHSYNKLYNECYNGIFRSIIDQYRA